MNRAIFCILLLSWSAFTGPLAAQVIVRGRIFDRQGLEPLAFVAIHERGSQQGTYSDIDGNFALETSGKEAILLFRFLGYVPLESPVPDDGRIYMTRSEQQLAEVLIRPGVNPAERIIQAAIDHKKSNDPEGDLSFRYDSYNKLVFTAAIDSAIVNDPVKYNSLDSSDKKALEFLDQQHLFLMESASKRKYMPPNRSEETIVATRVSGLKNPDFALLGTQLQSFSFYGEVVDILGDEYLSPLAHGSISKYLFTLEDTSWVGVDTVYTISFRPRKGKNFTGMQGQLFINTHGFALQNVLATPFEKQEGFNIRIQQKYVLIDGKKWFPVQLNSFIDMPFAQVQSWGLIGIGRSYLKNIELDADLRSGEFTPVVLQMERMATQQPDSIWNKYREYELDHKELKTYHVVDSVGKAENLDRAYEAMKVLATGLIPMGPVNFDLSRLMAFNAYEGMRLGAGLTTSDKLSQVVQLGGYYAYGFRDVHSKFGGHLKLNLYRQRNAFVKFYGESDVMETGGNQLVPPTSGFGSAPLYRFFISRMDRYEKYGMEVGGRLVGNLSATAFFYSRYVEPYPGYIHTYTDQERVSLQTYTFTTSEMGLLVRYAPGERLARAGNREVRLGGRFPIFWFRYTSASDALLPSDYAFDRYDVLIEKTFRIKNIGHFTIRAIGAIVEENVPLSLLYNAQGTNSIDYEKSYVGLAAPFSFETMTPNEFRHSKFAAIHLRHNFQDLLLSGEKFRPYISLVHNMLLGTLDHPEAHHISSKTAARPFIESGVVVDRLLKSGFSALGLGVFYRYGPQQLDRDIDNLAIKLSASVMF